jgi:hypothetical protein
MKRWMVISILGLCACEAQIEVPPGGIGNPGAGGGGGGSSLIDIDPCTPTVVVGTAPMRRLSHDELRYSLEDLFAQPALTPVVETQVSSLLADPTSLGFKNSAEFNTVQSVLAQQYMDAAEQYATTATSAANLTALLPCNPAGNEAACAAQFIQTFGARFYRRALDSDETAAYQKVYDSARAQGYDFTTGIQWLVFTFVQAPGFLYRVEVDQPGQPAVRPLTGPELATRLSYLIWQSVPDATLLTAVGQGKLATKADLELQARRMLADPRAQRSFDFFQQWLGLDKLASLKRDPVAFPNLDPNLADLLQQEAQAYVKGVVFDGDHTLKTLLTGQFTYANGALATHYGLPGVTGSTFQKVSWPNRRGGLLMLGGVLAVRDRETRTSIVRRGLTVRTAVMCQPVGAPPANVPSLGPIDQSQSQADRLAQHRTNAACASCHVRLDPLGSAFENIDAVGRDRTVDEGGHPAVSAGELHGTGDPAIDGTVKDGFELVTRLAQSKVVGDCFTTQFFRFSAGREEQPEDACSSYRLRQRFNITGGNIQELIIGLTQTDDFTMRRVALP